MKCGKRRGASSARQVRERPRRLRTDVVAVELGELRTVQHAGDRAILPQLTIDVCGLVFDSKVANASSEHPDERALMPIVRCCIMSLEDARRYGARNAAHDGLRPVTTTNSPGMRYPWLRRHGSIACL